MKTPRPSTPRPILAGLPVLTLISGLSVMPVMACDAGEPQRYAWVDRAPVVPAGRDIPEGERITAMPEVDDCGPLTGRLADGSCQVLATQDAGYVQRVLLPSGRYVMGRVPLVYDGGVALERKVPRWPNQPPRFADVGSYWIDLVEVTREAYAECVAAGHCTEARCLDGTDGRPDPTREVAALPQTCVTHTQAEQFCRQKSGRLPTATEWEYAARGIDARVFPWGNEIRDEIADVIMPTNVRIDVSYFGILGLGSNANEWMSDLYVVDKGLEPFATGFRDPAGPSARAREEWELELACGSDPATREGCTPTTEDTERYVIKGPAIVGVRAGRARQPRGSVPATTVEGWREVVSHPQLGFRCAADRLPADPQYAAPALPPQIPWIARTDAGVEIFGGIVEAVSRAEAEKFCAVMHLPREEPGGWRLPTFDEITGSANFFRGPGPFWTVEGAAVEVAGTWEATELPADATPLGRCVRSVAAG